MIGLQPDGSSLRVEEGDFGEREGAEEPEASRRVGGRRRGRRRRRCRQADGAPRGGRRRRQTSALGDNDRRHFALDKRDHPVHRQVLEYLCLPRWPTHGQLVHHARVTETEQESRRALRQEARTDPNLLYVPPAGCQDRDASPDRL